MLGSNSLSISRYLRALGAFYLRMTASSLEIWKKLEPLYNDYRKLRMIDRAGKVGNVRKNLNQKANFFFSTTVLRDHDGRVH